MLEEAALPASGVHPPTPTKLPPVGRWWGQMTVTPCACSEPRLLPQHGSIPPLCSLGRLLCPVPKGLGQYKLLQDSSLKRRAGCSCPYWERWEHPRSLAFAAVMGTPPPSTYHHPFPTPTMFFVCQLCHFYFIPFPTVHGEIKV